MTKLTKVTAALIAAGLICGPALAGETYVKRSVDVEITGLDLTDSEDAAAVLSKIRNAAKDVCDVSPGIKRLKIKQAERKCTSDAVVGALDTLADKRAGNIHATLKTRSTG